MASVTVTRQMVDCAGGATESFMTVQVQIDERGKELWVNVDGVCRFRAYAIDRLEVEDNRPKEKGGVRGS